MILSLFLLVCNTFAPPTHASVIDGQISFITAEGYVNFLNQVVGPEPSGIYDSRCYNLMMSEDPFQGFVTRSGELGNYHYEVIPGREYFPATYVSVLAGAQFCNWTFNGCPNFQEFSLSLQQGYYQIMDSQYNIHPSDEVKEKLNNIVQNIGYFTLMNFPNKIDNFNYWLNESFWIATSNSYLRVIYRRLAPGNVPIL